MKFYKISIFLIVLLLAMGAASAEKSMHQVMIW